MNEHYLNLYRDFLLQSARLSRPLTVVVDSSNGTTGPIAAALTGLVKDLEIIQINAEPHPDFPAHGPNPLAPGALSGLIEKVVELEADLGVAFDADGDRAFFVDDQGTVLPAHLTASLLYSQCRAPYVADELVYQALRHANLAGDAELKPSRVGSYFVKEEMRRVGATIGAEFSGHYYFKDFFGADSGIFAMLKLVELVSGLETKLSAHCQTLPTHILANDDVRIEGKTWSELEKRIEDKYQGVSVTMSRRDGLTLDFGHSWISIRSSNTEPLLRLVAGGDSDNSPALLLEEIKHVLQ